MKDRTFREHTHATIAEARDSLDAPEVSIATGLVFSLALSNEDADRVALFYSEVLTNVLLREDIRYTAAGASYALMQLRPTAYAGHLLCAALACCDHGSPRLTNRIQASLDSVREFVERLPR